MRKVLQLLTITLLSVPLFGQNTTESSDIFKSFTNAASNQGKITIQQDDQIKSLVNKYVEVHKKDNKIPGYRIRIFSNSGQSARQTAYSEKARFLKSYPDIPTYLEYEAPNFKVYVGDFRNKLSAFRAYKQISKEFRNAFLVPSRINLPKL